MITDNGLDRMGNNADWLTWCQVGTGSTAPSAADTALVSRLAGTSIKAFNEFGAVSTAPYYTFRRNTYRFAEGAAAGNLSEVSIGWASTGSVYSRELIRDNMGSPTTITVLSDEVLDVVYECRQYAPSVDTESVINLGGVDYDFIGRACNAASTSSNDGWQIATNGTSAGTVPGTSLQLAYNGTIGAANSSPTGISGPATSATAATYSSGTLQRDWTITWSNAQGNLAGGISAIRTKCGIGSYQFGFTPSIPKDNTKVLSLTFRHSWSRRT